MTTTTDTPTPTPSDEQVCPKCQIPLKRVEGTNVVNCNTCGYIGGDPGDAPRGTSSPQAEPVQPDEVIDEKSDPQPQPEPEAVDHNQVLEDAVASAMSMPGMPGRDEFLTLAQTARMLSMSPLVPKFLRNNPAACFHIAMIGRDLGISPTSAVELIDIMPDDRRPGTVTGRPMPSPELLNGQVVRLGLGSIAPLTKTTTKAIAVALAPGGALDRTCVRIGRHFYGTKADFVDLGYIEDGDSMSDVPPHALALPLCQCHGIIGETEFNWGDAIIAELVAPLCTPGDHKKVTKQRSGGGSYESCGCNQGYVTYPKQMMWWRASGFCQTENFPQASLGLYTPEAMGALVDDNGRMIDPLTVALPQGFEPEAPKVPTAGDPDFRPPAEPYEVSNVMGRIADLPSAQQTALKGWWAEKQQERRVEPVARLTTVGMKTAIALLERAEGEARAAGWEPKFVPMANPNPPEDTPPAAREPGTGDPGPGTLDPDSGVVPPGTSPDSPPVPQDPPQDVTKAPGAPIPPPEAPGASEDVSPTAPANLSPDLKVQFGQHTPILTVALVEAAISIVQSMSSRAVNDALRNRGMSDQDDKDTRYRNLAKAMAQEDAERDWAVANGVGQDGA